MPETKTGMPNSKFSNLITATEKIETNLSTNNNKDPKQDQQNSETSEKYKKLNEEANKKLSELPVGPKEEYLIDTKI